jgi:hypothetical protein
VRRAFGWVDRAAEALGATDSTGEAARRRLGGLLGAMGRHAGSAGRLAPAVAHFLKVTRSYWPGLFACYDTADLPRTNNDLEQFFGSHRYHERRASGRSVASAGTVVRGSVRIVASAATRMGPVAAADLIPSDLGAWRSLRAELEARQRGRTLGRRFRSDSDGFLRSLESALIKSALPP